MRLGDIVNSDALRYGKPLDGLRVLAIEQMQALPYATQLMARLGADVVKVEPPGRGDSGRPSLPAIVEPDGRSVGATFLRNNLNKKSVTLNLKDPRGRDLLLALVPHFDIVAQNSKAGALSRLGISYDEVAAVHPGCIYLSVSGFGNDGRSPYSAWPALAPVVEAMTGIYEMRRRPDAPPVVGPMGAIGDISAALFATVGVLAAVLHRQRTGEGQHVDIAMLDAAVAMTDIVTNLWSMGLHDGGVGPLIMDGFRAGDGWFVLQVTREEQFARMCKIVGHPEWTDDPRFATRQGWADHLATEIRPAVESWASTLTKAQAAAAMAEAGVPAGPCQSAPEVVADRHMAARHMLVEIPRLDDGEQSVITPGNPVKLSKVAEGPEVRFPSLGQHTASVLQDLLGLTLDDVAELAADGVV